MNLKPITFGKTKINNPMQAYVSSSFYQQKWLYIIAGIQGQQIEGVALAQKIIDFLMASDEIILPVIIIPVLNYDTYMYQDQIPQEHLPLSSGFPVSFFRQKDLANPLASAADLRPEISSLIELFGKYPPQMVIHLRTARLGPKVIAIGEEAKGLGEFISKKLSLPLIYDNRPRIRSLESFVFDFLLCPVLTIRMEGYGAKTIQEIASEYFKPLQILFMGQIN
jgi:protein MpaA